MSVNEKMTAIADAIREKTGGTEALTLDGMASAIAEIEAVGADYTQEQITALITRTVTHFPFPEGITEIGSYAFQGCSSLELTDLPETLTRVGTNAFYSCSKMAVTRIPDGVSYLGQYAFAFCSAITEMSIPAGISTAQAPFYACTNLTTFTFRGKPSSLHGQTLQLTGITVINCPWSEGEVAGAPWGATNATINYNYTEA